MTQNAQILADLERGKRITQWDAATDYNCWRLSGRIYDLRKEGHKITTEHITTGSGKVIAEYRLDDG